MADNQKSTVMIESVSSDLTEAVAKIMTAMAPDDFAGKSVLIKPNMVGPSAPELGHTTSPELVTAVVRACLARNAEVMVGDNPGGINHNVRNVAKATGILEASEGCYTSLSDRVVEKTGERTGFPLVVSRAVLEADYIINLPKFKTHGFMAVTGALKNIYGYVAGACKANLHLQGYNREGFADVVCDIHALRPPDLHIMDAITAIEGNGPCHGGHLREVGKLMASKDPLALDSVMIRMMGAEPEAFPVQKQAIERGLGCSGVDEIDIQGPFEPIPDFKMPVAFSNKPLDEEEIAKLRALYPSRMMNDRVAAKPEQDAAKCISCGDCVINCPPQALSLEPEFQITDKCIVCYCCVELCPEGALAVPDIEAFRHW